MTCCRSSGMLSKHNLGWYRLKHGSTVESCHVPVYFYDSVISQSLKTYIQLISTSQIKPASVGKLSNIRCHQKRRRPIATTKEGRGLASRENCVIALRSSPYCCHCMCVNRCSLPQSCFIVKWCPLSETAPIENVTVSMYRERKCIETIILRNLFTADAPWSGIAQCITLCLFLHD